MGFKDSKTSENSPQILTFPAEKQPSQLPIYIDDEYTRLFYLKYYPMVKDRCMGILRNKEDAEDMAHDVFAYVLEKFKKDGQSSISYPKTYLSKAAENMSINKKKREQKRERREFIEIYNMATHGNLIWSRGKGEQEQEVWEAGIIDNGYKQVEAKIMVKVILDEQDETTRKIYLLKYYYDKTLEQIGEAVGLKKSAVHERLNALEEQVRVKMGRADK